MGFLSPSYLVTNRYGYCFRVVVPSDLQRAVGRKELRYSLRTRLLSEAKYRARRMAGFVQSVFRNIRQGGRMKDFTEEEIQKVIQSYFLESLGDIEQSLATGARRDEDELDGDLETLAWWKGETRERLALRDYGWASPAAKHMLEEQGFTVDEDSPAFKRLCREILKAQTELYELEGKMAVGDYSDPRLASLSALQPSQPQGERPSSSVEQSSPDQTQASQTVTLSKLIEDYLAEHTQNKAWTPKSMEEFTASLELLTKVIGKEIPLSSIDRPRMKAYKDALCKLPPNMNKKREYRGKTINELLELNVTEPMSPTTVNKHLSRACTLFGWAKLNGYMTGNPAERLQLPKNKRAHEARQIFTQEDLNRLFHSPAYLNGTHKEPYRFWVPLLGLYTGARLDELCQLHLDDIRQVDGVWIFDINDEGEKKLKNQSSKRLVPIHPALVNRGLGFLDYVDSLKASGHMRLFPELKASRDGFGGVPSKWFTRYRKACGVNDEGKVFHSFRHTFIDTLKQRGDVDYSMLAEVAGHEQGSITLGRYGKRYTPSVLLENVISRVEYVGLNLEAIKMPSFNIATK